MGVTDESGYRVDEYAYGENGQVLRRNVLYDGTKARIRSSLKNLEVAPSKLPMYPAWNLQMSSGLGLSL